MKINNNIEKVLGIYKKQSVQNNKSGKLPGTSSVYENDKVELSKTAQEFHSILKAVGDVSDVRCEKVADIREKIAAGRYNVSAEETVQKILEGVMFDRKV